MLDVIIVCLAGEIYCLTRWRVSWAFTLEAGFSEHFHVWFGMFASKCNSRHEAHAEKIYLKLQSTRAILELPSKDRSFPQKTFARLTKVYLLQMNSCCPCIHLFNEFSDRFSMQTRFVYVLTRAYKFMYYALNFPGFW